MFFIPVMLQLKSCTEINSQINLIHFATLPPPSLSRSFPVLSSHPLSLANLNFQTVTNPLFFFSLHRFQTQTQTHAHSLTDTQDVHSSFFSFLPSLFPNSQMVRREEPERQTATAGRVTSRSHALPPYIKASLCPASHGTFGRNAVNLLECVCGGGRLACKKN